MIIALDGPAGAGKSTVARRLAEALRLPYLDTGAMYRAVTLVALERGVHPGDAEACAEIARSTRLEFDDDGAVLIDGRPGEPDIRSRTVTRNVSAVSAHPAVREALVAEQRDLASRAGGVVAEGRDTTTVVFPEADHKFFLNASSRERARRRALQEGAPEQLESILADIERRDRLDTTRAHAPLVQAPDAIAIDADELDAEAVAKRILALVTEREHTRDASGARTRPSDVPTDSPGAGRP